MFKKIALAFALSLGLVLALLAPPARALDLSLDGNLILSCGTATGTSNASTLANKCGVITTESVTTAAAATFTETITATAKIAATDICFASVATAGTGTPAVAKVTPGAGSLVVIVQNIHASVAFNNTLLISYLCVRP